MRTAGCPSHCGSPTVCRSVRAISYVTLALIVRCMTKWDPRRSYVVPEERREHGCIGRSPRAVAVGSSSVCYTTTSPLFPEIMSNVCGDSPRAKNQPRTERRSETYPLVCFCVSPPCTSVVALASKATRAARHLFADIVGLLLGTHWKRELFCLYARGLLLSNEVRNGQLDFPLYMSSPTPAPRPPDISLMLLPSALRSRCCSHLRRLGPLVLNTTRPYGALLTCCSRSPNRSHNGSHNGRHGISRWPMSR